MDNKLSELSKPVAQIYYDEHDSSVMRIGWLRSDEPKNPETLYSQEYVSALLAELEAKKQAHRVHAARLISERGVLRERIAELEAIRAAAEKLVRCKGRYHSEQNYRSLAALFGVTTPDLPPVDGDSEAVIAELRAKLATPVRLPALLNPESDAVNGMIFANGRNEAIAECSIAIRQVGFLSEASPMTIEEDE